MAAPQSAAAPATPAGAPAAAPAATPPCTSCAKPPPRPWQLFTSNAAHEGTYEAYTASVPGGAVTYTNVHDYNGENYNYVTTAMGAAAPAVGVSAGTWASNGTADDYWMGAGHSVAKGAGEYGWNDNGYNVGIGASASLDRWNPLGATAVNTNTVHAEQVFPTNTTSPTVTMPSYDVMGNPDGGTQEIANPHYRPSR